MALVISVLICSHSPPPTFLKLDFHFLSSIIFSSFLKKSPSLLSSCHVSQVYRPHFLFVGSQANTTLPFAASVGFPCSVFLQSALPVSSHFSFLSSCSLLLFKLRWLLIEGTKVFFRMLQMAFERNLCSHCLQMILLCSVVFCHTPTLFFNQWTHPQSRWFLTRHVDSISPIQDPLRWRCVQLRAVLGVPKLSVPPGFSQTKVGCWFAFP